MGRKNKDFQDSSFELIEFFRANPVLAAQELLFVDLPAPQRIVFEDMWEKPFNLVTAGRGSGKTFILSVFSVLYALLYPGRRVLLMSPSFRQCVVGDTLVNTDKGFEFVGKLDSKPSSLLSSCGVQNVSGYYKNLPEPTKKIVVQNGYHVEGALDHRVLSMGEGCELSYETLSSITHEDYLCILPGSECYGSEVSLISYIPEFKSKDNLRDISLPKKLTNDMSYFLGLLVGDGCLTKQNYIDFINTDVDLLSTYNRICTKYFGKANNNLKSDGVTAVSKGSKLGYKFLNNVGLAGKGAGEKTIPDIILKAPKKNQVSFIRGLFDTDGCIYFNSKVSHPYKLHYASISEELVDSLQILLLNMGILSAKTVNKSQRKNILYCLEVSNKKSILKYYIDIGFGCSRKQDKLRAVVDYIGSTDVSRNNKDILPYSASMLINVVKEIRDVAPEPFEYLKLWHYFDIESRPKVEHLTQRYIGVVLEYCGRNNIDIKEVRYLKAVLDKGFVFLKVKSIDNGFNYTYDFTVDKVHDYFSNGFISHNSKMVFEEVMKRYSGSPILRETCVKKPIIGSDRCYLHLRGYKDRPGAAIEAYPLGTGEKVRGLRGHVILADEFAQIPKEIFDMVIRPMGAATASPMENVRRIKMLKDRLEKGVISIEDYDRELVGDNVNKIVGVSSAYYQFNHMYDRIRAYEEEITKGSNKYAVHYISYRDMPEGFLDKDNIEEAKISMSRHEFSMEYDGVWESDSDGAFKASLVEKCKDTDKSVETSAIAGKEYILGIDPARSSDAFAIVVIEKGNPSYVVNAYQVVGKKFPEMAHTIFDFCEKFNVSLAMMDAGSGGGGVALKDLLANNQFFKGRLIIDIEDEEYKDVPGRRILKMHDPKPKSIAEANFAALNLLERGMLKFAKGSETFSKENEVIQSNIDEMIKQMISIVITETKSGLAHFDIPSTGKNRKKDLYSAFILASKALYDSIHVREEFDYNIPGLVKSRDSITSPPKINRILNIRGK